MEGSAQDYWLWAVPFGRDVVVIRSVHEIIDLDFLGTVNCRGSDTKSLIVCGVENVFFGDACS